MKLLSSQKLFLCYVVSKCASRSKIHCWKVKTPVVTTLLCCYSHGIWSTCFGLYYKAIIREYEILQESWFSPVQWLYRNTQLRSQPYQQMYNMEAEIGKILCTSCIIKTSYKGIKVPYFPAHKTHFFPEKCDLNSTCVLCAEGKYYFQTYKYPYPHRVKPWRWF